jgi:hypothetical protein
MYVAVWTVRVIAAFFGVWSMATVFAAMDNFEGMGIATATNTVSGIVACAGLWVGVFVLTLIAEAVSRRSAGGDVR